MDEFSQQLCEVEKEASEGALEFPELSHEARKECQERLDQTVKTLLKIQKDLVNADPDARTVCVVGLDARYKVHASDFTKSFARVAEGLGRNNQDQAFIPHGLDLTMECNYMVDGTGKVLSGAVDERFITFEREKDACRALRLDAFSLRHDGCGTTIKFIKPVQSSVTRATFRKIGVLVERVRAIE
jgi:hypothetical protein